MEMFKNLLVVICLDLNRPENLVKSFLEWYDYIFKTFKEYLGELDISSRNRIIGHFE